MSRRRSDESFVAFAGGQRERLVGAATLLGGTSQQSHDLVAWAMATTYPRWGRSKRPDLDVVRLVLESDPGVVELPWRDRTRVQLVDAVAPTLAAIPAALQRLPRRQRMVLVGRHHLGLSDADLGTVTGLDPVQLDQLHRDAVRVFGPDVTARLASAVVPGQGSTGPSPATLRPGVAQDDLDHGRWVQRRRRARMVLVSVVVALLAGILVLTFGPTPAPTPVSAPGVPQSTPGTNPSASTPPPCDTHEPRCQVQATRAWRAEIATLVATALDPDGRYFTGGFSYTYDERYDGYWSRADGALGLNLLSADGGATQVFVQIATSRASAVACGTITVNACVRQQFLDGNWFTLTPSVDVAHGMEVQYRPDGDEVITVAAYDTTKGRSLDIGRADLLNLVQDPRLRLPPR
ncbi:MAG: hypothetical protein ACR2LI_09365 [Propionibacteriaceae bacterium]